MEEKNFNMEASFAKLDEIINKLEDNDVTLSESLKLYSDGVMLLRECNDSIDKIEKELTVLKDE